MKFILVLYLAATHPDFDDNEYVMAAVSMKAFESLQQCIDYGLSLRDESPDYVIGSHCMQTRWEEESTQPPLHGFAEVQIL